MKKLLLFIIIQLLIIPYALAIEVQRTSNGIVFMFESATGKHCWALPQTNLDLSMFPTTAMDIEAAAKQYNWPTPTGDAKTLCDALTQDIWKVQPWRTATTRPVYALDPTGKKSDTRIDTVNINVTCGAYVQAYSASITKLTWRLVTGNAGKQGAAVCEKQ